MEAQTKAVVSQLEERPLAKMQEALDAQEEKDEKTDDAASEEGQAGGGKHHAHKPLLTNDDWELERVWTVG